VGSWWDDPARLVTDTQHLTGRLVADAAHGTGELLTDAGADGAANFVDEAGDKVGAFLAAGQVPEAQLGQTTSPTELIHGDPAAITGSAEQMQASSQAFEQTAAKLESIDLRQWTGAAADAFRAKYGPQPGRWRTAAAAYASAAASLQSYAATLSWAQRQAQQAIDLYEQGYKANQVAQVDYDGNYANWAVSQNQPGAHYVPPPVPAYPGNPMIARAEQMVTEARQRRNQAAAAEAVKVSDAAKLAPTQPTFWQRVADDLPGVAGNAARSATEGIVLGPAGL
jgi:hypothetical protein